MATIVARGKQQQVLYLAFLDNYKAVQNNSQRKKLTIQRVKIIYGIIHEGFF